MKIKIHIKITPDDNTVDDIYIYIYRFPSLD